MLSLGVTWRMGPEAKTGAQQEASGSKLSPWVSCRATRELGSPACPPEPTVVWVDTGRCALCWGPELTPVSHAAVRRGHATDWRAICPFSHRGLYPPHRNGRGRQEEGQQLLPVLLGQCWHWGRNVFFLKLRTSQVFSNQFPAVTI